MAQQYSVVTSAGRNKLAEKIANNAAIALTEIALGSGAAYPSGGEIELETEVHRGLITGSGVYQGQPDAVFFDLYVDANVATFHAQQIGLFDEDGILYAISRFDAPVPKFGPASDSISDQTFRIVVKFSDIENVVVNVNPVAGLTADNLPNFLPWASDPEFNNKATEGRIAHPKQIHTLLAIHSAFTADILKNNLIFPEIETADAKLLITDNADGTLTIDAAQTWLWRGVFRFSSDDINLAGRTVTTVANKTYHVRWHAPGTGTAALIETYPYGRIELVDMTGVSPTEGDPSYDTTYDNMLVARIVTDGANASTITTFINRASLSFSSFLSVGPGYIGNSAFRSVFTATLNWARTPKVWNFSGAVYSNSPGSNTFVHGGANIPNGISISRYGWTAMFTTDFFNTNVSALNGYCIAGLKGE